MEFAHFRRLVADKSCEQGIKRLRIAKIGAWGSCFFLLLLGLPGGDNDHLLGFAGSLPTLVLMGVSAGFFAIPLQTYIQARPPKDQKGRIIVDEIELTNDLKHIEQVRREVGMVFQHFNLFPHLTVLDNLTLGPIWVRKMPKAEAEAEAMRYLERVKIPEQAKKFPGQLSSRPSR